MAHRATVCRPTIYLCTRIETNRTRESKCEGGARLHLVLRLYSSNRGKILCMAKNIANFDGGSDEICISKILN